jgi:hypothetical protein
MHSIKKFLQLTSFLISTSLTVNTSFACLTRADQASAIATKPHSGVPDSPKQATWTLTQALSGLSKATNSIFIIEGDARGAAAPEISKEFETRPGLPAINPEKILTRAEYIADAFDYEVFAMGNNVFVLQSRYLASPPIPAITLEEASESLRRISMILSKMNPHVRRPFIRDSGMSSLIYSLTPDQLAAMRTPEGLPVASLPGEQKEQIRRFGLHQYLQKTADSIEAMIAMIRRIESPKNKTGALRLGSSQVLIANTSSRIILGLDIVEEGQEKPTFFPLDADAAVTQKQMAGATVMTMASGKIDKTGLLEKTEAETQAEKSVKERESHLTVFPREAGVLRTTIGDLTKNSKALAVDAMFKDKPITLVGFEAGTEQTVNHNRVRQIAKAIAAVYGLRDAAQTDGSIRITRRKPLVLEEGVNLNEAIRELIPDPLLRAVKSGNSSSPMTLRRQSISERGDLRKSAIRYLTESTKRSLRDRGEREDSSTVTFPISQLSPRDRTLLSFCISEEALAECVQLADQPVPPSVTNIETLILVGGLSTTITPEGKKELTIVLKTKSSDKTIPSQIIAGFRTIYEK